MYYKVGQLVRIQTQGWVSDRNLQHHGKIGLIISYDFDLRYNVLMEEKIHKIHSFDLQEII